jgi:hypothetical protein
VFTIVGLIVAVAAALILLVGVLHAGGAGMEGSKASNAAAELAQLELGIQNLYSAQAAFTGLTNTVALAAGSTVVPDSMNAGSGSILNEWGGAVTIAVAATPTNFKITEAGIPQSACATLATKVSNAVSVSVNAGAALTTPVDVGAVTTACNSNTNSIVFTFGH